MANGGALLYFLVNKCTYSKMDCVKNIGCFANCDPITFPFLAMETGEHILTFEWMGTKKTIVLDATAGEEIIIPNYFNDHSDVIFTIKMPSGKYYYWSELVDLDLITCPEDYEEDCQ